MKEKKRKVLSLLLALVIVVAGIPAAGFGVQAADDGSAEQEYEIYPTPQDISYGNGVMELGETANLVIEDTIDDATVNRLNDILAIKNIAGTRSESVASGVTNVLVGTKGSGGAVESWFDQNGRCLCAEHQGRRHRRSGKRYRCGVLWSEYFEINRKPDAGQECQRASGQRLCNRPVPWIY